MKRRQFIKGIAEVGLASLIPNVLLAKETKTNPFIKRGFSVLPPNGWIKFLDTNKLFLKQTCIQRSDQISNLELKGIYSLNQHINNTVKYAGDHPRDKWEIAKESGDCEDFALRKLHDIVYKNKLLPRSCFSVALCTTEKKKLHLVLILHTLDGDYVLDSRFDHITTWNNLPYNWLSIEGQKNSRLWTMII
ncbi:transglutaminase-like cysteine peptidase [Kiloniella sp. EL199]|uniref:transglutaminase-like cysteine peptidase n=1 Tax=Kiloniella sp. EL199 TaxID=2107581 RepID=UPI000EA03FE8|nr:transglutaminase-like cysteine peptidase [Kiloniella sp. EL199]